jgi:hypothetical protein
MDEQEVKQENKPEEVKNQPKAFKMPRMFNGKPLKFVHPSKNDPRYTRKYADNRQVEFQRKVNPPFERIPVVK